MALEWTLSMSTLLTIGAIVSIICRVGRMHLGETRLRVFLQHLALAAGLVLSLVVDPRYAIVPLVLGVSAFLGLGAHRWKHGAPEDTRKWRDPYHE